MYDWKIFPCEFFISAKIKKTGLINQRGTLLELTKSLIDSIGDEKLIRFVVKINKINFGPISIHRKYKAESLFGGNSWQETNYKYKQNKRKCVVISQ